MYKVCIKIRYLKYARVESKYVIVCFARHSRQKELLTCIFVRFNRYNHLGKCARSFFGLREQNR